MTHPALPKQTLLLLSAFILEFSFSWGAVRPYLLAPSNEQVTQSYSINLKWGFDGFADSFHVQVSTTPTFNSINFEQSGIQNKGSLSLDSLAPNEYYWRIKADTGTGYTNWSDTLTFRTVSPSQFSGLSFWYLPDSGLVSSNGEVLTWKDQSNYDRELSPPQVNNRPSLSSSLTPINGYPSPTFDGNDDYLVSDPFNTAIDQGNTTIVLGRVLPNIGNGAQWYDGINSSGRQLLSHNNYTDIRIYAGSTKNFPNATAPQQFNYLSTLFDGPNSKIVVNGSDSILTNPGSNSLSGLTIGSRFQNNTNFFSGNITEIIGYDSILPDSSRRLVEKYLRHKYAPPVNLGPNVKACDTTAELSVNHYFENIDWSTGDTTDTITVDSAGTYWVEATGIFGYTSTDTVQVTNINTPIPDLQTPSDTSLCLGDTLIWDPELDDTATYDLNWSTGSSDSTLEIHSSGSYQLTVNDSFGCSKASDSLEVFVSPFPDSASLGPDTNLCSGNELKLLQGAPAAASYQWSTSETSPTKTLDTSGTYWLDATDTLGCPMSDTVDVTIVGDAPTPSFSFGKNCNGDSVQFQDSTEVPSGDNISSWTWSFGDSDSSSLQNPSHLYPDTGDYTVSLQVTLNTGCQEDTTDTLNVHPLPDPWFSHSQACARSPISFMDSSNGNAPISDHAWDFGDPNSNEDTLNGDTVEYEYDSDGFRTVQLTVTDSNACTDSVSRSVEVLPAPEAAFSAEEVCIGETVHFQDQSNGPVDSLYWDFGDGQFTTDDSAPDHLYPQADDYEVKFVAIAANGCQDDSIGTLQVHHRPVAEFSHEPLCQGAPVEFSDESSVGGGDTIGRSYWSLDGDLVDSGKVWSPTFPNTGPISIFHEVVSDFGCKANVQEDLVVNGTPNVELEVDPSYGEPPLTGHFTAIGSIDSAVWSFGDGASAHGMEPSHTYQDSGTFEVRLIGIDDDGCKDSAFQEIFVLDPRIDVRIPRLFVEERSGYYKVEVLIQNLGPIVLNELELELRSPDAPGFRETWSGSLGPGESEVHEFQGRIEKGEQLERICIKGERPNGIRDSDTTNNEACWAPEGGLRILGLYPNPSQGRLNLEIGVPFEQKLVYQIVDARGRLVQERSIEEAQKGFLRIRPSLEELNAGPYTIRVIGEQSSVQRPFIKSDR